MRRDWESGHWWRWKKVLECFVKTLEVGRDFKTHRVARGSGNCNLQVGRECMEISI